MADELDPIAKATLELDASRLVSGSATAQGALSGLTNIIRDNWWGVKNMGMAFAGLGAAVEAGLGAAVKAEVDFQNNMVQVARTSGIAGESGKQAAADLDSLGQQLRALALTKPVDLGTITNIAKEAGALGIAKDNIAAFTGTIVDLVATTDLTDTSAVKLARIANAFNLTQNDYKKLGSAIYDVGVHSAATEAEIVNMSVRFAGIAAGLGFTAAQTTALSSVLIGLGQRPQSAITAVQRTIENMQNAVVHGGNDLRNFTNITGLTADQFKRLIDTNPMEVFERFIEGLNRGATTGSAFTKVMDDLNIKDVRQQSAISALAKGVNSGADSYNNLRYSVEQTTKAYEKGTELGDAAQRQYQSASNQLKILSNTVHDVALGFGQFLLPPLVASTKALEEVVSDIDNLPGPLKDAVDVVGVFGGSIALLAGGFLLVGPRILLAVDAVGKLKASYVEGIAKTAEFAVSQGKLNSVLDITSAKGAFSFGRMSGEIEKARIAEQAATATVQARVAAEALRQKELDLSTLAEARKAAAEVASAEGDEVSAAAARLSAAAYEEQAVAAAGDAAALEMQAVAADAGAVAMDGAAVSATLLGAAIDIALGPVGIAIGLITVLAVAVLALGRAHKQAAENTNEFKKAEEGLTQAFIQEIQGSKGAVQAWLIHQLAMTGALKTAGELGVTFGQLYAIILGSNTAAAAAGMNNIANAARAGNADAQALVKQLHDLNLAAVASSQAANEQASANRSVGNSADGAAASTGNLTSATKKQAQASVDTAQGILDLVSAQQALKSAQDAVTKAEHDLAAAHQTAAQRALDLRTAEDNLTQSQIERRKAIEAVRLAEDALSTARADALQKEQDDTAAVSSAQLKYQESLLKITDAEKALAELRAGPTLAQITDATNKLADARLNLQHATTSESDAEWYLNYLIQEGASARDIADAHAKVATAKQGVADATQKQVEAQTGLDTLQAGPSAEDVTKEELAVQQAYLDSQHSLEDLTAAQNKLKQDRKDIASDKAYKDAQDALTEAQIKLDEANAKVVASTDALHKTQKNTDAIDKLKTAQDAYSSALFQEASAIANVKDAQMEAAGIQVDSATKAHNLADAMMQMAGQASGPVSEQLRSYAAELFKATPASRNTDISINPAGAVAGLKTVEAKVNTTLATVHKQVNDSTPWWEQPLLYWGHGFAEFGKGVFGDVLHPIANFFSGPFVGFFTAMPGHARSAVSGIKDAFYGLNKFIGNIVIDGVNIIIEAWDGLMSRLAHTQVKFGGYSVAGHQIIPGFDMGLGFMNDLKIQKLPRMASGGIVSAEQMFTAGEAGPEAIIPLDQLQNMFAPISTLALEMAALNSSLRSLASLGTATGMAGAVQQVVHNVTHEGDTNHIVAQTNASAADIAGEIAWSKLTRRR